MKRLRQFLFYIYIAALISVTIFVFIRHVEAGTIRKLPVSSEKSGLVRLAFGRNTTISFLSRPEKVVPGSPQSVEVSFIGKDLNIRPLRAHPGNLTVYTKSERIILLLQLGSELNYDDVVEIVPVGAKRGINLIRDTYR